MNKETFLAKIKELVRKAALLEDRRASKEYPITSEEVEYNSFLSYIDGVIAMYYWINPNITKEKKFRYEFDDGVWTIEDENDIYYKIIAKNAKIYEIV